MPKCPRAAAGLCRILAALLLLTACWRSPPRLDPRAVDAGGGLSLEIPRDLGAQTITFRPSDRPLVNPERGFYATTDLATVRDMAPVRGLGRSLAFSYVHLDRYRTRSLPPELLARITDGFAAARRAGIKIVLRFAYNEGPFPHPAPDAPKVWVLKHIAQVAPLLKQNQDVIAVVQAGFIGAWGEWHSSTNHLTTAATEKEILEALLAALPTARATQIRTPGAKQALYGAALEAGEAFTGTARARIGHHNDCFLAGDDDSGTYQRDRIDSQKAYLAAETQFLPMGGETCAPHPPRSACAQALAELQRLHVSFLNGDYEPRVLAGWKKDGCLGTIDRQLGYRLVLTEATLPRVIQPGVPFSVDLKLRNEGWAAPFNARPVVLVLEGGGRRREHEQEVDPRRWLPGAHTARLTFPTPADLPAGRYRLALWLPDAATSLRSRPEYSIRLANEEIYVAATADHTLGMVEVAAPLH